MNEQRAVRNKNMILNNDKLDNEEDVNNNIQNSVEAKINRESDILKEEKLIKELGLEPYSTIPIDVITPERENFAETEEEKQKRLNIIMNTTAFDNKKSHEKLKRTLKIVFLTTICILIILFTYKKSLLPNNENIGDPYHCEACKLRGKACARHRDFSKVGKKEFLRNKIDKLVYTIAYENNTEEQSLIESYYSTNNSEEKILYEQDCDFCTKQKSECVGCKSTRLELESEVLKEYNNLIKSEHTINNKKLTIEEINFLKSELYKKYKCNIE